MTPEAPRSPSSAPSPSPSPLARYSTFATATQAIVPALLQIVGLIGFLAAVILWLAFQRREPELIGICVAVAAGGFLYQSKLERLGLKAPPPPPTLSVPPPDPTPEAAPPA